MDKPNNAYHQAIKDISKTNMVLVNTDIDPFKGSYSRLNKDLVKRGYLSYYHKK
jgi:hypothetical protein